MKPKIFGILATLIIFSFVLHYFAGRHITAASGAIQAQIAAQKAAADAISEPLQHNDPPISMNPFPDISPSVKK